MWYCQNSIADVVLLMRMDLDKGANLYLCRDIFYRGTRENEFRVFYKVGELLCKLFGKQPGKQKHAPSPEFCFVNRSR